jgi:hypothetical protein
MFLTLEFSVKSTDEIKAAQHSESYMMLEALGRRLGIYVLVNVWPPIQAR